jgi:DNA-binding transcriptional regulator YbjK
VPSRQEVLLDAAIEILGRQGIRALTYRAVDAEAGMPTGSTANYHKSRTALIDAVVDRFVAREKAAWRTIADLVRPTTRAELALALTAYVRRAVGADRTMTLARFGLFVEAALRPELQHRLAESAAEIRRWGADRLREIGSTEPQAECALLFDHLDGVLLHQLAFPTPPGDLDRSMGRAVQVICATAP